MLLVNNFANFDFAAENQGQTMAIGRPSLMLGTITGAFVLSLLILMTRSFTSTHSYDIGSDERASSLKTPSFSGHKSSIKAEDRPLILYAYSESDHARENLKFFINQGLHNAADFVFIFNGPSTMVAQVPEEPNIRVVERSNTCFDLGTFGEVLQEDNLYKRYKRFITMNASIRGPFVPFWSDQCWSDAYLDELTDETKVSSSRRHRTVLAFDRG